MLLALIRHSELLLCFCLCSTWWRCNPGHCQWSSSCCPFGCTRQDFKEAWEDVPWKTSSLCIRSDTFCSPKGMPGIWVSLVNKITRYSLLENFWLYVVRCTHCVKWRGLSTMYSFKLLLCLLSWHASDYRLLGFSQRMWDWWRLIAIKTMPLHL
jgi:hypothetical protein